MLTPGTAAPNLYAFFNPQTAGLTDTTGLTEKSPTLDAERTGIFILEGQSLWGDHVQGLYQPTHAKVQNVCVMGDKKLYQQIDPMLGPTFTINGYAGWSDGYGCMAGKLGDLLIDGNVFDRVIFCNVSYGGLTARDLSPAGQMGHRLPLAFHTLNSLGIKPSQVTAILSHLGESDGINGTSAADFKTYRRQSLLVARNFGFTGPWFLAKSTWAYGSASTTIQGAIDDLVAEGSFLAGAASDSFVGSTYRYLEQDGTSRVHPNATGRDAICGDWFTKLDAVF